MKLAFICGAYRAETHNEVYENIQKARAVALKYWKLGYAVICPHCNSAFMSGACDEETFLNGYLEILKRCDIIVMMKDWELSKGTAIELLQALKLNKEVICEN